MKEKLIEYIKGKYNPVAIVLHGSRANGNAKEHSDWDFLIFTKSDTDPYREVVFGANIEIKQALLPISDSEVSRAFGYYFRKENTETLFDPENIVEDFLAKNEEVLAKGNNFDEKDISARYAFLKYDIDGMRDYRDDRIAVFNRKADFYNRAAPAWFRFKHKEFKPSDYIALPRIKKEDPEFYKLLETFVNGSVDDSIESGEKIIRLLFPDLI